MQYRPPYINQEFPNTNHFGSISDSLGRLSASSECRASVNKVDISLGIMMYFNWINTALAENTLTKMDLVNRAVIPPQLATGRLMHFSVDNIDINDGTLDGKHTLHATLYKTWQRVPSHVSTLKSMTLAKHAMFAVPGVMDTICHASDTGVITEQQFHNGIQVEWFNKTLTN